VEWKGAIPAILIPTTMFKHHAFICALTKLGNITENATAQQPDSE